MNFETDSGDAAPTVKPRGHDESMHGNNTRK